MYKQLWQDFHNAVCSINFYSDKGIKLTSFTGFKANQFIVTDERVYSLTNYDRVVFQFVHNDGFTHNQTIHLTYHEFTDRINRLTEYEKEGYALIDIEDIDNLDIPSMIIETGSSVSVGESIGVIGYHIDQENISLHKGIVSSFFKSPDGKRFIQFDAAIKQGNSGSPLINLSTGKVIGVVGYRLSSITRAYESFKLILDENLKMLKKSEGKMTILDIDPIQVLVANQHQLKQISREFYRSATLSFGYAHEIHSIFNYIDGSVSFDKKRLNTIQSLVWEDVPEKK